MDSANTKLNSARAFVRSLNILLKYARLYSFGHARTMEQFNNAWNELHAAIPPTNESGLLLGATGEQLLLDGMPVDAAPAERSFAQLLWAAGLASIQFTSQVTREDFERFVRAFPTSNTKPSVLAEQLKAALAGVPNIRINEVRFVAEDASKGEALGAGLLTAHALGADANSMREWLRNPQKLLQLIAAAEGLRRGSGSSPGASGPGRGYLAGGGTGSGNVPGAEGRAGSPASSGGASGDAATGAGSGGADGTSGRAGSSSGSEAGGVAGGENPDGSQSAYSGATLDNELIHQGWEVGPIGNGPPFHGEPGGTGPEGGGGVGASFGSSPGSSSGARSGAGRGGIGTGAGGSGWSSEDEDILGVLKLLTSLAHTISGQGDNVQPGPLQEELTRLPSTSQEMLRQALIAVAAQTPAQNARDPMLLRLAEHLAIKFALERYERGEVKVNAVRQMFEKMSQEIDGLRKLLGSHEQKLADAGVIVETTAELLDQQFWAAVPERGKRAVLTSPEAWCIPARNLKQYVEQLLKEGDEQTALAILQNYASGIQNPESEARRRTAIGLANLADVYAVLGGRALAPAIQMSGAQLSLERDDNLQGLISAAFVRLSQEAGARRFFPALLQSLDSLESVEHHRLVLAQSLRPRIGVEKRVPEFLEDLLRGDRTMDGLDAVLQRVPRSAAENLTMRFNRTANRADMQRLEDLARAVGTELLAALRDSLRAGSASEAAETAGLLSRLDPSAIERWLPERLGDWPRQPQDRAVRPISMGGAGRRGNLLVNLLHALDPVLLPLAMDEIGLSEDASCIPALLRFAAGIDSRPVDPFVRLKAVEALGRFRAMEAADLLRGMAESRHMFHWAHPGELRLAAAQSLAKIEPGWLEDFASRGGFGAGELALAPLDAAPDAKYFRRRRYQRIRLAQPIVAIAYVGAASYRLEIRGLSLSGGIAAGDKHLPPGTLVSLRIGSGLRPIRAQVLMRDARAHALGFEIAEMDLDERARLRKLLLENKPPETNQEEAAVAQTSA